MSDGFSSGEEYEYDFGGGLSSLHDFDEEFRCLEGMCVVSLPPVRVLFLVPCHLSMYLFQIVALLVVSSTD